MVFEGAIASIVPAGFQQPFILFSRETVNLIKKSLAF